MYKANFVYGSCLYHTVSGKFSFTSSNETLFTLKFARGYEKNMSFLWYQNLQKFGKKLKNRTELPDLT